MTSHARCFGFRGTKVGVTSTDRTSLEWLEEFLCPWFEATDEAGDTTVHFSADDGAFAALERSVGNETGHVQPCFALDTSVVALPAWERDGRLVLLDDKAGYYVVIHGRRVEIVARRSERRARVALMRAVRELTCTDQRRRGGIELHASAFAVDGAAIVIAGPKRAGKTTLLTWALSDPDARIIANDRLFAFLDAQGAETMGIPTIVSVRAGTVERFPRLGERVPANGHSSQMTVLEMDEALAEHGARQTPSDVRLSPAQFTRLLGTVGTRAARIAAVVFPEVVDEQRSELTAIAGADAVARFEAALYGRGAGCATTVVGACISTQPPVRSLAERVEALAGRVPCYHYRHGRDAYARSLRSGPFAGLLGT